MKPYVKVHFGYIGIEWIFFKNCQEWNFFKNCQFFSKIVKSRIFFNNFVFK